MSPHSGRKKSATHSYQCVFNISGCTMVWLPVFGVLTYAQMLMHAFADGGCTDSVRGPALEVDSERERERESWTYRGLEPASVLRLVFQSDAVPTELFPPALNYKIQANTKRTLQRTVSVALYFDLTCGYG